MNNKQTKNKNQAQANKPNPHKMDSWGLYNYRLQFNTIEWSEMVKEAEEVWEAYDYFLGKK